MFLNQFQLTGIYGCQDTKYNELFAVLKPNKFDQILDGCQTKREIT